jgi:catechol 2,3-dioxygenase-like lactoylglutathione lyase family enzyme
MIDHCVIAVSDWGRSNAFYRGVLGAEVDQKTPGSATTASANGS